MSVRGIDVSHWQAQTPALDGLGFVFARATYGTAPDDRYAMHKANTIAAGRVFGAYAFGRDMDGASQAMAFLGTIGSDVQLVALDYEKDADHGHMTPDQARAFIRAVQATGRKCGLYASDSGYPHNLGQDWRWVAKWGPTPPDYQWAFWQYQGSPLDHDLFNGSIDELRRMAGQESAMPLAITNQTLADVALTPGDQVYNPDGTELVKMSVASTKRSPYGVTIGSTGYRVVDIVTGGKTVMGLVPVSQVTIAPVPPATCSDEELAAAFEKGVAEEQARMREVLGL